VSMIRPQTSIVYRFIDVYATTIDINS
jgi:hypothetical protein